MFKGNAKPEAGKKRELEIPPAPPSLSDLPEIKGLDLKNMPVFPTLEKKREEPIEIPIEERVFHSNKPIFVNANVFKDVLEEIKDIKNEVKNQEDHVAKVTKFCHDETQMHLNLKSDLIDLHKKLMQIDKTLFSR